jgi:hypothetical protein
VNLRSGAGIVDSGRDKHPALAVDDHSPVVVAHIKWLEEVGRTGAAHGNCNLNHHNQQHHFHFHFHFRTTTRTLIFKYLCPVRAILEISVNGLRYYNY